MEIGREGLKNDYCYIQMVQRSTKGRTIVSTAKTEEIIISFIGSFRNLEICEIIRATTPKIARSKYKMALSP